LSEFAALADVPPQISIDGGTPAEEDAGSDESGAPVVPPEPALGSGTTSTQGGSDEAPASDASGGSDPNGDAAGAVWVPVPRADWRDDAAYAKECPEIIQPAKSVRLAAIGKLRKEAAEVLQRIKPQQEHEVEHCLWPLFSEYAECVLDKMAEAELGSISSATAEDYGSWLKSACLPAIIRDVCGPIFGQFPITLRYVVEQIGEVHRPDDLVKMRQVLWHMISDAILPAQGSALFRLEIRLTNAILEERVPHWEAKVAHLRPPTTPTASPDGVRSGPARADPSLVAKEGVPDQPNDAPVASPASEMVVPPGDGGTTQPTPSKVGPIAPQTESAQRPEPTVTDADRSDHRKPASDEQFASLSDRDTAIHKLVGEQTFRTLTNAEIMGDRTLKKKLREQHKLNSGDQAKSCLDRIRRAQAYPLSREIKKNRSNER